MQSTSLSGSDCTIAPLSDRAVLVSFANKIDPGINLKVIQFNQALLQQPFAGLVETVTAYASLAVFYDLHQVKKQTIGTAFDYVKDYLYAMGRQTITTRESSTRLIKIPVCYHPDYAPDIKWVATINHLSVDEVVRLHSSIIYQVYMIGFLPGFPYLGSVPLQIQTARKEQPRLTVPAGSVGIAGGQTGIYPVESPGGWQLIGRTPLVMFDADQPQPCLLSAGDQVQFIPIDKTTFEDYYGNADS